LSSKKILIFLLTKLQDLCIKDYGGVLIGTLLWEYWSMITVRCACFGALIFLVLITVIRWPIYFWKKLHKKPQATISFDRDGDFYDAQSRYYYHGRIHNDSSIHIKNAFVQVVAFSGKVEPLQKMSFQWQGGIKEKIDIAAEQTDCIFDYAVAGINFAQFVGFINGSRYEPKIENGILRLTVRLFGEGITETIQREVTLDVAKRGGLVSIRVIGEK
jgi:hypothetical protein